MDIVERLRTEETDLFRLQETAADEIEALRRERDELADKADAFDARWNTALTQLAAMAQERDEWKNACEQKTEIMRSHSDERRELQLQVLAAQAYAAQWWRVKI